MRQNKVRNILTLGLCVIVLQALDSCKAITSFVHDGQVIAKVGSHKLYETDIEDYIPDSASPEDSTRLALQYINSWASEMVFIDVAEKELSKNEKNVEKELEDYRRSLLKYRYEQKFINQRLDTAVTMAQIEKYYDDHIENFKLQIPIAKARFMSISADSPNLAVIKKKMSSSKAADKIEADSMALYSAIKYTDFGNRWVDMVRLSREFGTDYGSLLSVMKNGVVELPDNNGTLNIAFISEMKRAGETGPVDFYRERIKDIILGTRKQALLSGLERDLLENARNQENFVIY